MKTHYKFRDLPLAAQKHCIIFRIHRFLDASSIGMFSVVIVLLLQDRGFGLFDISILLAVFSGTGLILELPLGGLADGIGRKPVFMVSVLAFLVSILLLILFTSYWLTMLSLVFMGLRMALMSGTMVAWFVERFVELAPEFSTQPALAKNQFYGAMGLAISSIFGGLIADFIGPEMVKYGFNIYEVPLIGSLILGLGILSYTHIFIIEEGRKVNISAIKSGFTNLGAIMKDASIYGFKHRVISIMLVGSACSAIAIYSFQSFWIPFAKPMLTSDFATSIIGVLTFCYFFSQAIGAIIAAPAIRLFNGNIIKALAWLSFVCALSLFAISITSHIYAFAITLILFTLFVGSISSPYASIFHDNVPNDKRSTLLSLDSLMGKLGQFIGLLFIGYIAEQFGIATAFQFGAIFIIAAGLLFMSLSRYR